MIQYFVVVVYQGTVLLIRQHTYFVVVVYKLVS